MQRHQYLLRKFPTFDIIIETDVAMYMSCWILRNISSFYSRNLFKNFSSLSTKWAHKQQVVRNLFNGQVYKKFLLDKKLQYLLFIYYFYYFLSPYENSLFTFFMYLALHIHKFWYQFHLLLQQFFFPPALSKLFLICVFFLMVE